MGGRTRRRKKTEVGPFAEHSERLADLDSQLAAATTTDELVALATEYHGVGYTLANELGALALDGAANDTLVTGGALLDRASAGKRTAAERAAHAFAQAGNLKHAVHHLFKALGTGPDDMKRAEIVERIATLLETRQPAAAVTVRNAGENVEQAKSAIEWAALPTGA